MKTFNGIEFYREPGVIFAGNPSWPLIREPVLAKMEDGSLVCWMYAGGPTEPHWDNLVLSTRSSDGGKTWSEPEVLFSLLNRAVWGTEIYSTENRTFAFVHTYVADFGFAELRAFMTETKDSGKTWSKPVTIKGCPPNFAVRQGLKLSNGDLLFPMYWMEQAGGWGEKVGSIPYELRYKSRPFKCGVIISSDGGETFSTHGYLTNEENWFWEPTVIELTPGHLLMYIRAEKTGVIWESESHDYGRTWTKAKAGKIPNPGTKFYIFKIDDKIIFINNTDPTPNKRHHLELWISEDNCQSWKNKLLLAKVPNNAKRMICYPHAVVNPEEETLLVACDSGDMHYLLTVPYRDFL